MSQENVEIVRANFEAWNAGDMDALRERFDRDVIMRMPEDWPEPGPHVGREAVMRQLGQQRETWDADTFQLISDFIDVGDRVAVRFIWLGAGYGPQANVEATGVYTVRKGKVFAIEHFWDHAEALETLELSEQAMWQENVELVRRFFEAVDRVFAAHWQDPRSLADSLRAGQVWPEFADVMRCLHPNIEWKSALIGITTRGYEGTVHGVDQFLDAAQDYRVNILEVTGLGDSQVLAVVRLAMKGKASDIDVNATTFSIVTVEDGLIIRLDEYLERAEALEAVGLSEQDAHADS